MLKGLQKLDRKLGTLINLMDRTLQDPINRVTTFDIFRQNGTYTPEQQVIAKGEFDTNHEPEITAAIPDAPLTPAIISRDKVFVCDGCQEAA